jgi:hypothetical protein
LYKSGDFVGGAQFQEHGRMLGGTDRYGDSLDRYNTKIINPNKDKIKNSVVVIVCESGMGDQIFYSRFFKLYKQIGAKKVIVACHESLKEVFARIDGVDKVISRDEVDNQKASFWVPGLSSGYLISGHYDGYPSDPWITPNPKLEDGWDSIINCSTPKIGIKFDSNPFYGGYKYRKFPPEYLFHIKKYKDLTAYSLEYEQRTMPDTIIPLSPKLETFDHTCSAISKLDLVITTDTSVAHLAGAMGKETWIVVPVLPSHYWAPGYPDSTTSPFYPNMKIYRQEEFGNWYDPFKKVFADLESKFGLKRNMVPFLDKDYKKLVLPSVFN